MKKSTQTAQGDRLGERSPQRNNRLRNHKKMNSTTHQKNKAMEEEDRSGSHSDQFDNLPDEVLQLIFSAVADCKTLVRCMAVSRAFRGQASKVPALSISCPGRFSSYDQKLRSIYVMVKAFRDLESLIVRVGQPKDELPPSWARCMRYAEIGASVEKFVFMAAKSGDFAEFDCAVGLGPNVAANHHDEDPIGGGVSSAGPRNGLNLHDGNDESHGALDPGILINNEISLGGADEEEDVRSEQAAETTPLLNPRSERSTPGSPVNTSPGLGVYMFTRNTDAPTALETSTTTPDNSSENFHATLNTSPTPTTTPRDDESFPDVTISDTPGDGDVDGVTENHGDGEVENNEGNLIVRRAANGQHRQRSVPGFQVRRMRDIDNVRRTLDFHLRQVIAPSNDVLKRMVPVIVFAIVQGLDEFRDSVPTFIDRFKKLKRLLLVDMVESVTVHMREHQIKQVREQRLGGRVGDSEATDQGGNTIAGDSEPQKQNHQEMDNSDEVKFSSAEDEGLAQWAQRNENMNRSSNARDRGGRGKKIITVEDEFPTGRNSLSDGSTDVVEPSTSSSPCVESSHRHFSSSTSNLMQSSNDDPGLHKHSCENCKEFQMRYPFAVCQDCLVQSRSSFVATSNDAGPSPVEEESATRLAMDKFMGKHTCQDDSVKKWLSGKRSLAGSEEPSSSSAEPKYSAEIGTTPNELGQKKLVRSQSARLQSFDEIMACRLRDEMSNELPRSASSDIAGGEQDDGDVAQSQHGDEAEVEDYATESAPSTHRATYSEGRSGRDYESSCSSSPYWKTYSKPEDLSPENEAGTQSPDDDEEGELDLWQRPKLSRPSSAGSSTSRESNSKSNRKLQEAPAFRFGDVRGKQTENNGTARAKQTGGGSFSSATARVKPQERGKGSPPDNVGMYKPCRTGCSARKRQMGSTMGNPKETKTRLVGKQSFKRGLRADTSRRREGERASRIGSFRKYQGRSPKDEKLKEVEAAPVDEKEAAVDEELQKKPQDLGVCLIGTSESFPECGDVLAGSELQNQGDSTHKESKGKQVVSEPENEPNLSSTSNDVLHYTPSCALENSNNGGRHYTNEGVVCVPYESSDPTTTSNRLQAFSNLEDTGSEILDPDGEQGEIGGEGEGGDTQPQRQQPIVQNNNSHLRLMDLPQYRTQIGAIRRERGRRLLRGSRSSREGQIRGESEQTREARRRDRMHAGIRKRQRDIEREALFFEISFWRAEEVVTPSYVLLDVSMCIATHNAKPLSPEELNIISIYALAGPLLAATVAHVNEQVKSHNL